jgi:O-antigen/teichoic acid export membrane protein
VDPFRRILRHSATLGVVKVLSALLGMAMLVLLPRLLGDAEFGRLHLAVSIVTMVGVAADLGLTQVVTRAVAQERRLARAYLVRAAGLIGAVSAALYVLLLAGVEAFGHGPKLGGLVAVLGVAMILDALTQLLTALFQAHERMGWPPLARLLSNAVCLAILFPALPDGSDARTVALVLLLAAALRVVVLLGLSPRLEGLRAQPPHLLRWRGLVVAGLPFVAWQALGAFYFRMDAILLGWLTTDATVGWYGAASRLVDGLTILPEILTVAMLPVLARLRTENPDEFVATSRRTLDLLLVATVPLVAVLVTSAEEIVHLLFTATFAPTVPILRIHALMLGVLFVDFYLATVLVVLGRERAWLAIAVGAAILNPTLNSLLIPFTAGRLDNGGIGAAAATLTTEVVVMVCALRRMPDGFFGLSTRRVAAGASAAGAAVVAVLLVGRAAGVPWVLAAAAAGLVYLGAALRLGLVDPDLWQWVRSRWARRAEVAP